MDPFSSSSISENAAVMRPFMRSKKPSSKRIRLISRERSIEDTQPRTSGNGSRGSLDRSSPRLLPYHYWVSSLALTDRDEQKGAIIGEMSDTLAEVEGALAVVQRVHDALTTRGNDQAAFDLAKAQYSASIRTSWPGNLSSLIRPLEAVGDNEELKLTPEE